MKSVDGSNVFGTPSKRLLKGATKELDRKFVPPKCDAEKAGKSSDKSSVGVIGE